MDITKRTSETLVLEHQPTNWIVGMGAACVVLLIGLLRALVELSLEGIAISLLMLVALGWLMLTRIVRRLQLSADRAADRLEIKATTPLKVMTVDYPLSALLRAEVQTCHGSESIPEPALMLVMADTQPPRRVRLDAFRPDPASLLAASEQINQWLEAGRATPDERAGPASPLAESTDTGASLP